MAEQDFVIAVGSQLQTRVLGKPLHFLDEIDSTNTYAMQLAQEGAGEGTVVVADAQSKGKGRLGRTWASPPGVNLYCSIILRPRRPTVLVSQINLLAAIAVAETIIEVCHLTPAIKWPNDVLIKGKKVCGILAETRASRGRLSAIVLGIGVNLNAHLDAFPEELREKVSSLFLITGKAIERSEFTASLLTHLEKFYLLWLQKGFLALRPSWEQYAVDFIGQQIAIASHKDKKAISGTVLGLDEDGALLVRQQGTEKPQRVLGGEVTVIDGYQKGGQDHDPRD